MNTERLLKLADFLETMPPQKFRFDVVLSLGSKEPAEALAAREESCGTVACAMGWLPSVFPNHFAWDLPQQTVVDGAGRHDFGAAESFFGLELTQTWYLFDPVDSGLGSKATAKEVAAHIRGFVREGGNHA